MKKQNGKLDDCSFVWVRFRYAIDKREMTKISDGQMARETEQIDESLSK